MYKLKKINIVGSQNIATCAYSSLIQTNTLKGKSWWQHESPQLRF